jgi:hypothetical protein
MIYRNAGNEPSYISDSDLVSYFEGVQRFRQENRLEEAISSLLELVDATEEDSLFTGLGVTAVYYEQLAILFRERKEYAKEVAILTRYARQKHVSGDSHQKILEQRLKTAKELLIQNKSPL